MKKVFLGGTCNNSTWRDELIPMLKVYYFNPVVANWTPECQAEELRQRESCDYCLYVITPEMTGVYSIAEVTDDSNKRPHKTLFCFLSEANGKEFDKPQIKSLQATSKLIEENGAKVFESLKEVAEWINSSHLIPSDSDLTYEVDSNGTERWYDSKGKLTHYKDSNGYEEWYEYDSNGNRIHIKDSTGYEEWKDYDSNGNRIHYKDSNGYERWYEYDSNGKLIHYRNSDGYEEWYEYDSNGNKTHSKNSNGYESWYEYDSNGKLTHFRTSSGYESWYEYDSNGNYKNSKELYERNDRGNLTLAYVKRNGEERTYNLETGGKTYLKDVKGVETRYNSSENVLLKKYPNTSLLNRILNWVHLTF